MDIRYLQYFTAIAEERNMTKAAERLHVAQSSLSYQLNKLEGEVGVPLFLRTKNDMILTTAGSLYRDAALKVIAIRDHLYQNIADLNCQRHLRISVSSIWGIKVMTYIFPELKKMFPDLVLEINHTYDLDQIKDEIAKDLLDFALIATPFYESAWDRTELLGMEELLFAVSADHPYVRDNPRSTITQQELADRFFNEMFLVPGGPAANHQLLKQIFQSKLGALPPKLCRVNGFRLVRSIVEQGAGVAFIPVSGKAAEDKIRYYSCEPKIVRYNIMVHRENLVFNKAEQCFFDGVKTYYQDHIGPIVTASLIQRYDDF